MVDNIICGEFLMQVTNQLVLGCKAYIRSTTLEDEDDVIWPKLLEEINTRDDQFSADLNMRNFQAQIESHLKVSISQPPFINAVGREISS